jgi:hypothetical protein
MLWSVRQKIARPLARVRTRPHEIFRLVGMMQLMHQQIAHGGIVFEQKNTIHSLRLTAPD